MAFRTEIPLIALDPTTGDYVEGASVEITNRSDDSEASVYTTENGSTIATQPLETDAQGRVSGWLNRGQYTVAWTIDAVTTYESYDAVPGKDGTIDTDFLADDSVDASKLAANSVDSTHLQTDSVTASEISAGAVGTSELADDSISNAKLKANSVDSIKLKSDSVTNSNRSVTADHIRDDAVTVNKIADGSVTAAKLGLSAVSTTKISDDAVTVDKIAGSSVLSATIGSNVNLPTANTYANVAQLLLSSGVGTYLVMARTTIYDTVSSNALLTFRSRLVQSFTPFDEAVDSFWIGSTTGITSSRFHMRWVTTSFNNEPITLQANTALTYGGIYAEYTSTYIKAMRLF